MIIENYDSVLKWSYPLAKKWVKSYLLPLGVNSSRKFSQYKKKGKYLPDFFPRRPDDYFRNRGTWKGWNDFFGNPGHIIKKKYYDYQTALNIVQKAKIRNVKEYKKWAGKPKELPVMPHRYYRNEWKGWPEFLGDNYSPCIIRNYSKLTETDVKIIKSQLSMGVAGATLAKYFKVSEMQISRIKNGENWNNI